MATEKRTFIEIEYLIMETSSATGLLKIPEDRYSHYGYASRRLALEAIIANEDYSKFLVIVERPVLYKDY